MAMHTEFVVPGPPISSQQNTPKGKTNLATWIATIAGESSQRWLKSVLTQTLKVIIINFYQGTEPSVDLDNMAKPILDAMQALVYEDDRQIIQLELAHTRIDAAYNIPGVRPIITTALQAGQPFVYVRIDDPVNPFPLPK